MPSDIPQKPSPPILGRFRALLRDRDEQMVEPDDGPPPPPTTEEIVGFYEEVLAELTFNSKPIITELTMIAGEHKAHGAGIADAICSRILEVPIDQKLPSLYLLDSIVKNIGREYARHFSARLPEVFCESYKQVHPNLYPAMRHLFGTWSAVFPNSVLHKIEAELQFSPRTNRQPSSVTAIRTNDSPSPRPAHGIHVNPKYLEARRQFEHSKVLHEHEADVHSNAHLPDFSGERSDRNTSASPKGWSSAASKFHFRGGISSKQQAYGRGSASGYGDYDDTDSDMLSSEIDRERVIPHPNKKFIASSSPRTRIDATRSLSPAGDGLAKDTSERDAERVSPFHSRFSLNKFHPEDEKRNNWRDRNWSSDGAQGMNTSSFYNFGNGHDQERPRALIDAYGKYRGKSVLHDDRLSKFEKPNENSTNSNPVSRNWQNIEVEEYDWEDMSPTLADRNRGNDSQHFLPSDSSYGNINLKAGIKRPSAEIMDPSVPRNDWRSQIHASKFSRESTGMRFANGTDIQNGSLLKHQGTRYPYEPWNVSQRFPRFSMPFFQNPKENSVHMPFALSGTASSEVKMPFQRITSDWARTGLSSIDSSGVENLPLATPVVTLEKNAAHMLHMPSLVPVVQPTVHSSYSSVLPTSFPQNSHIKPPFDLMDMSKSTAKIGPNNAAILSQQQLDVIDGKTLNSSKPIQLSNPQAGLIPLHRPSQEHLHVQTSLQQQDHLPSLAPPIPPHPSANISAQPGSYGHLQGQNTSLVGAVIQNALPGTSSSTGNCTSAAPFPVKGVSMPPLPPGPPPSSSQTVFPLSTSHGVANPPGTAISGLISSLVAQGLISLTTTSATQDSVGVEFNLELLKIRHESAINALYVDLPRQCTTCGLRFKFQEEHSNHMDWHVTRNRSSKNRKQNPSRKWFVNVKEWLSGAEALGTDALPGFLPTEAVTEKGGDEEMAVPADENQSVCALCGEPFDDFYSDETEEWMYKGAVYMNAPVGSMEGMERSKLGTIVHAKCRSESTTVPLDEFKEGTIEEDGQRKGMQI